MNQNEKLFLEIFRSALQGNTYDCQNQPEVDLDYIFRIASQQKVLPMIYEAIYRSPIIKSLELDIRQKYKEQAIRETIRQIEKTNDFLNIIVRAQEQGLYPVVTKGIIVKYLYPVPMLRPSVDEDLLIIPEEAKKYHTFFLKEGLQAENPDEDIDNVEEKAYLRSNTSTFIELHKTLFPTNSDAYGDLNYLFKNAMAHAVDIRIEDVVIKTLSPTDHLLFLICHAYKHFLHSGIGIRHIADIAVFINNHNNSIDWSHLYSSCEAEHIEIFSAALFQIARKYLTLDSVPVSFSDIHIDEKPLLEDILTGGLYGAIDINRLHSGNMTLDAVSSRKKGKQSSGLWHSLFPGKAHLQKSFPYAKKYPILLPIAWGERLLHYLKNINNKDLDPVDSLRIGQERIRLLKQYGILD